MIFLSKKQFTFVDEYVKDLDGPAACVRAGYVGNSVNATQLLNTPKIKAAIEKRLEDQAAIANLDQAMVIRRLMEIAFADPSELIQHRVLSCRHCWSKNGAEQMTEVEFEAAVAKAIAEGAYSLPDGLSGFYEPHSDPNEHCIYCHGSGIARIFVRDTRKLEGAAKSLYAGIKETKNGLEIQMHSQMDALKMLAQITGAIKPNDNSVKVNVAVAQGVGMPLEQMTLEQLQAEYARTELLLTDATD